MSAAPKLRVVGAPTNYARIPDVHGRVKGNGRAIAAAKFRELANKLESGELDGARVQWLDTHGLLVEMELDGKTREVAFEAAAEVPNGAKSISGLEFVTRTAWTEYGSGRVQIETLTIEEI